ncbi:hypothetical protein VBZ67_07680 [Campylobacter concisus]
MAVVFSAKSGFSKLASAICALSSAMKILAALLNLQASRNLHQNLPKRNFI